VSFSNFTSSLASFDVLLDQRGRIEFRLDVVDALHQFLHAVDDGGGIDALGSIFRDGFDDEREFDVVCVVDIAAIGGREIGRLNSVKGKHLLGDGFVLRQDGRVRSGAGVGDIEQVQECSDLHLLGVVARIGFGEVEDEVGVAFGECYEGLRAAVEHVIRRLVAQLRQGFEDLFAVVFDRLLLARRFAFALARCRNLFFHFSGFVFP
jgi:hypothetical protein